jgi:hypothetical protein
MNVNSTDYLDYRLDVCEKNLSLLVIKRHDNYERKKEEAFSVSAVHGGYWSASRSSRFSQDGLRSHNWSGNCGEEKTLPLS